jgi:hypothetical protein
MCELTTRYSRLVLEARPTPDNSHVFADYSHVFVDRKVTPTLSEHASGSPRDFHLGPKTRGAR